MPASLASRPPSASPLRRSRAEYEAHVPAGILRTGWLAKHQTRVPAVAVLAFEGDVRARAPEWAAVEAAIVTAVGDVRAALEGRRGDALVLLVQPPPSAGTPGWADERAVAEAAGERMTALRRKAGLDGSSLTLLFASDFAGGAPSRPLAQFEAAVRERALAYYARRKQRLAALVKGMKWTLPLQAPLRARLMFKLAHLSEFRARPVKAAKYYQAAFGALAEGVRVAADADLLQYRAVAEIVTYKLLAHYLSYRAAPVPVAPGRTGQPGIFAANSHMQQHLRAFEGAVGDPGLQCDHWAWVSRQYALWGELLARTVAPSVETKPLALASPQFHSAALYAIRRRRAAEAAGIIAPAAYAAGAASVAESPPGPAARLAARVSAGLVVAPPMFVGALPAALPPLPPLPSDDTVAAFTASRLAGLDPTIAVVVAAAIATEARFPHHAAILALLERAQSTAVPTPASGGVAPLPATLPAHYNSTEALAAHTAAGWAAAVAAARRDAASPSPVGVPERVTLDAALAPSAVWLAAAASAAVAAGGTTTAVRAPALSYTPSAPFSFLLPPRAEKIYAWRQSLVAEELAVLGRAADAVKLLCPLVALYRARCWWSPLARVLARLITCARAAGGMERAVVPAALHMLALPEGGAHAMRPADALAALTDALPRLPRDLQLTAPGLMRLARGGSSAERPSALPFTVRTEFGAREAVFCDRAPGAALLLRVVVASTLPAPAQLESLELRFVHHAGDVMPAAASRANLPDPGVAGALSSANSGGGGGLLQHPPHAVACGTMCGATAGDTPGTDVEGHSPFDVVLRHAADADATGGDAASPRLLRVAVNDDVRHGVGATAAALPPLVVTTRLVVPAGGELVLARASSLPFPAGDGGLNGDSGAPWPSPAALLSALVAAHTPIEPPTAAAAAAAPVPRRRASSAGSTHGSGGGSAGGGSGGGSGAPRLRTDFILSAMLSGALHIAAGAGGGESEGGSSGEATPGGAAVGGTRGILGGRAAHVAMRDDAPPAGASTPTPTSSTTTSKTAPLSIEYTCTDYAAMAGALDAPPPDIGRRARPEPAPLFGGGRRGGGRGGGVRGDPPPAAGGGGAPGLVWRGVTLAHDGTPACAPAPRSLAFRLLPAVAPPGARRGDAAGIAGTVAPMEACVAHMVRLGTAVSRLSGGAVTAVVPGVVHPRAGTAGAGYACCVLRPPTGTLTISTLRGTSTSRGGGGAAASPAVLSYLAPSPLTVSHGLAHSSVVANPVAAQLPAGCWAPLQLTVSNTDTEATAGGLLVLSAEAVAPLLSHADDSASDGGAGGGGGGWEEVGLTADGGVLARAVSAPAGDGSSTNSSGRMRRSASVSEGRGGRAHTMEVCVAPDAMVVTADGVAVAARAIPGAHLSSAGWVRVWPPPPRGGGHATIVGVVLPPLAPAAATSLTVAIRLPPLRCTARAVGGAVPVEAPAVLTAHAHWALSSSGGGGGGEGDWLAAVLRERHLYRHAITHTLLQLQQPVTAAVSVTPPPSAPLADLTALLHTAPPLAALASAGDVAGSSGRAGALFADAGAAPRVTAGDHHRALGGGLRAVTSLPYSAVAAAGPAEGGGSVHVRAGATFEAVFTCTVTAPVPVRLVDVEVVPAAGGVETLTSAESLRVDVLRAAGAGVGVAATAVVSSALPATFAAALAAASTASAAETAGGAVVLVPGANLQFVVQGRAPAAAGAAKWGALRIRWAPMWPGGDDAGFMRTSVLMLPLPPVAVHAPPLRATFDAPWLLRAGHEAAVSLTLFNASPAPLALEVVCEPSAFAAPAAPSAAATAATLLRPVLPGGTPGTPGTPTPPAAGSRASTAPPLTVVAGMPVTTVELLPGNSDKLSWRVMASRDGAFPLPAITVRLLAPDPVRDVAVLDAVPALLPPFMPLGMPTEQVLAGGDWLMAAAALPGVPTPATRWLPVEPPLLRVGGTARLLVVQSS